MALNPAPCRYTCTCISFELKTFITTLKFDWTILQFGFMSLYSMHVCCVGPVVFSGLLEPVFPEIIITGRFSLDHCKFLTVLMIYTPFSDPSFVKPCWRTFPRPWTPLAGCALYRYISKSSDVPFDRQCVHQCTALCCSILANKFVCECDEAATFPFGLSGNCQFCACHFL